MVVKNDWLIHCPWTVSAFVKVLHKLADLWELILFNLLGIRFNDNFVLGDFAVSSFLDEPSVGEIDDLRFLLKGKWAE